MFRRRKTLTPCEVKMKQVDLTLQSHLFSTYYQSIVTLMPGSDDQRQTFAIELLNRPEPHEAFASSEHFYSFVASHGRSQEVDVYTIRLGLQRLLAHRSELQEVADTARVFVNVHLSTLFSEPWTELLAHFPLDPHAVVLELSEREGLAAYTQEEVLQKIHALRQQGFQIAVDDVGIAYSGLYTLAMVHPEYVKIDRQLVSYIEKDAYRMYMMKALLAYWRQEGVAVIAEGIERKEEADFFAKEGAVYAQGYFFHRPARIE
ncbi:EAL domain-containing protein [Sulfoacidibacillus thermotolerans]|uniref:EAL domain-containing protein n=1 Tax=Sulfoacidibacillus thermotolerans TaxID=1765684 RepID=A0A2U3D7Q8_SULT2|nr:EAL domain-containing protein [Sulfoacidibacillus thermotolerans]PWI57308.1 hypothetical protein BM613_09435 [Sulfoacidibacillus thermotolerans]